MIEICVCCKGYGSGGGTLASSAGEPEWWSRINLNSRNGHSGINRWSSYPLRTKKTLSIWSLATNNIFDYGRTSYKKSKKIEKMIKSLKKILSFFHNLFLYMTDILSSLYINIYTQTKPVHWEFKIYIGQSTEKVIGWYGHIHWSWGDANVSATA